MISYTIIENGNISSFVFVNFLSLSLVFLTWKLSVSPIHLIMVFFSCCCCALYLSIYHNLFMSFFFLFSWKYNISLFWENIFYTPYMTYASLWYFLLWTSFILSLTVFGVFYCVLLHTDWYISLLFAIFFSFFTSSLGIHNQSHFWVHILCIFVCIYNIAYICTAIYSTE
jgi:hypothetical protein